MRVLSLFSGIGGFDLGFERAGMTIDSMCEIDKAAQSVLRRRFPQAELFEDVRKIGEETHGSRSIDLICGGFPCQDLSIAGKRKGMAGERSGLWFEYRRIIEELKPGWVVIENVPGLLSSNGGKDFAVLLRGLGECGYLSAWRILDSQYFGLAQRRRRVFIVASFGNGRAAEILFESEGLFGDSPKGRKEGEGTSSTFTVRSGKDGGGKGYLSQTLDSTGQGVLPAGEIVLNDQGGERMDITEGVTATLRSQSNHPPIVMSSGQGNAEVVMDGSPSITLTSDGTGGAVICRMTAFGEYADDGTASTIKTRDYKDATDLVCWEMSHASEAYRESGETTPTARPARMGTGGNNVPMVGVRRLTPTECERLQGFPDGWTDGQSDTHRYKQLGNAVSVPVAEWIGKQIMKAEDK